jgi:signal peptidase I
MDGDVYVNGSKLDEPYVKNSPGYRLPPDEVPADNYFVLGDNRNNSNDSHNGWTVSRSSVIGKAWLSIWPPGRWGFVLNYLLMKQ